MYEPPGADGPDISCPACNFLNPSNRLYCQDCGAKLRGGEGPATPAARSGTLLPTGRIAGAPPTALRAAPRHAPVAALALTFLRLLIYAFITAVIIQVVRSPEVPPAAPAMDQQTAQSLRDRLTDMDGDTAAKSLTLPWSMVNAYLAERVPPAPTAGVLGLDVEFLRVIATPDGESFRLLMERRIQNYPFYVGLSWRAVPTDAGVTLEVTGGSLGRLPLPAPIAALLDPIFRPVGARLFYELDILDGARNVSFSPEAASVQFD